MTRLVGAVLYAKDLAVLAAFYSAVADLEIRIVRDDHIVLGSDTSELVIVRIPRDIADKIDIGIPPARREQTPIKLVFSVAEIGHARREATKLGGVICPESCEWEFRGAMVCDGHDPEGNIFQLRALGG